MIKHDFINYKGNKYAYIYTYGNNDKLVVMIHGLGMDKIGYGNFDILSSRLFDAGFDSLRFDLIGHGESSGSSLDLTLEGTLEVLEELLKVCDFKKLYLLGASYGCAAATLYPKTCEKIVLWSPAFGYKKEINNPKTWFVSEFLGEKAIEKIKKNGYANFGITGPKFNMNLINDINRYDPVSVLREKRCDIKIFHGDNDKVESYETSLRLEEMVPNVLVEIIKGGSHCFNDGTSGEVIEKTINFLES